MLNTSTLRWMRKRKVFCHKAGVTEKGFESAVIVFVSALLAFCIISIAAITSVWTDHDDNIDANYTNQEHVGLN